MVRGILYRYLIPSEVNYVTVRPLNIYGFMESGKTTLSLKIAARVEEEVGDKYGFICLVGRRQRDLLNYLEENKDVVKDNQFIVMVYDDAGRYYMSRESSTSRRREEIKDFLEIRHIFEGFGMEKGVIIPIFNIQYYNLLEKTLRNTPCSLWKTVVLMDRSDRREFILSIGWRYYYFLKVITKAMYLDKYVFTRGEVGVRGVRGDQIYSFLYEFFREKGGIETEGGVILHRDFVKRFSLLVLLDEKVIMDFGNELKKPKNLITVEPPKEDENWWMPVSQEEKRKILWWIAYISLLFDLSVDDLRKNLQKIGLSISNSFFSDLRTEISTLFGIKRSRKRKRKVNEVKRLSL
ncbi:MAG: hypothetical protein QW607_10050 [Desulfurococcaceae archaeon]